MLQMIVRFNVWGEGGVAGWRKLSLRMLTTGNGEQATRACVNMCVHVHVCA